LVGKVPKGMMQPKRQKLKGNHGRQYGAAVPRRAALVCAACIFRHRW